MVMNTQTEAVLREAMKLSADDRAALAERLWDSLHREIDPETEKAWIDEINRRIAAYDRGEIQSVSLEEAMQRIQASRK